MVKILINIVCYFSFWIFVQVGIINASCPDNPESGEYCEGDIVITEFFYKSAGNIYEYIEIFNTTDSLINLEDWIVKINGVNYEIEDALTSYPNDYTVLYSSAGTFIDSLGNDVCSDFNWDPIFNFCWQPLPDLYWLLFPDLSDGEGSIQLIDNTVNQKIIDKLIYSSETGFPVGVDIIGRSVELIIDPSLGSVDSLNDIGDNWRSSQHYSEWLWNENEYERGSPLITNFILPYIEVQLDSTVSYMSDMDSLISNIIYMPTRDGYPGGIANLKLIETAEYLGETVDTDSVEWIIYNSNDSLVNSSNSNDAWHATFTKELETDLDIFSVSLFSISNSGFMGEAGTTVYLGQENNDAPVIVSINNQIPDSGNPGMLYYYTYENVEDSLFAVVSDLEICPMGCTFTDDGNELDTIIYNSNNEIIYDNSLPFLWVSDSVHLLSSDSSLTTYLDLTYYSIDSTGTLSANENPDTLIFKFYATDPFSSMDSAMISVVVNNFNQPPTIQTEIPDTTILEDSCITFLIDVYDIDGDEPQYTPILRYSTNYETFAQVEGDEVTFCPEQDFNGSLEIIIIVSDDIDMDGDGLIDGVDEITSNLEVISVNDSPTIDGVLFWPDPGYSNGYYHIPEDTVNFIFDLEFNDIDSDVTLNSDPYNLENLTWSFNSELSIYNEDTISHVYASKTGDGFVIESLLADYNGPTGLKVIVKDDDLLYDTFDIPIFIDPRNDSPFINNVLFDTTIIVYDNLGYHIPEDTINVEFSLNYFDIDADSEINEDIYNLDNLIWSFYSNSSSYNKDTISHVFASKTLDGFIIDSLLSDYNGPTGLIVIVSDEENLLDSIDIPLYIVQRNDLPQKFRLFPINEYCFDDCSTIDIIRDELYFRLPQNEDKKTINQPEKLRFEWERINGLDVDIDTSLNKDSLLSIYYRLELFNSNEIFVLADSIYHNDEEFSDSVHFRVDIDFIDHESIDITGYTTYKWRVIAQNNVLDNLFQISSGWDSTDFKIDFIQPEVKDFNIMMNQLYPSYYDVLWGSNGLYLTDSTFITINNSSQFNPRQITDSLYHFTGIIPINLDSAIMNFNLQLRDKAMNSGEWVDTVSFARLQPNVASSFSSPSGLARVNIDKAGVDEPVAVFIAEKNINTLTERNTFDIYQLTPSVHFTPQDILLNNKGGIDFEINEYLSPSIYNWQYVIMEITDEGFEKLDTYFNDGIVSAELQGLSSFAVYVNLGITRPIPTTFKLQQNYPNPFNPTTIIPLEIPEESFVKVSIYNILGNEIVILLESIQSPGYQNLQWNGNNEFGQRVSSGIYFVRVHYNEEVFTNKMMLLK